VNQTALALMPAIKAEIICTRFVVLSQFIAIIMNKGI
jgi:hypothetical protein